MTPSEGFVVGFLMQCADAGLSPEQTELRVKAAAYLADRGQTHLVKQGGFWDAVKTLGLVGTGAAVAGPVLAYGAGSMTGRARADLAHDTKLDAEALKQQELLAELDRQIAMLETAAASRHRRLGVKPRIRGPQLLDASARRV